jgi:SAM-dependent methyltransferase
MADCAAAVGGRPGDTLQAALLGVTPSIAGMSWPAGTTLWAIDWSARMIRAHWSAPARNTGFAAMRADWRELPLRNGSIDFAIGDGCYTALRSFADAEAMNRELARVVRTQGLYCLRCFARPARPLSPDDLFERLKAGAFADLDLFRWLLSMAVQGASPEGVEHARIWEVWSARADDVMGAIAGEAHLAEALIGFERMKESKARYYFPDLDDLRRLAEPWFDLLEYSAPDDEWGECFPRVLMRRRA